MKSKKLKKYSLIGCLSILSIGIIYSLMMFYLIQGQMNHQPTQEADTIIVLGAKVWGTLDDPKPSPVLKERLDTAYLYLADHPNTKVIVTGGQGNDEPASEASVMRDYLLSRGITEERILLEDQSTSTIENLQFAQNFGDLGHTLIVTSDYHSYRALMMAQRFGIEDAESLPAPSESKAKLKDTIREIIALGYHIIFSN